MEELDELDLILAQIHALIISAQKLKKTGSSGRVIVSPRIAIDDTDATDGGSIIQFEKPKPRRSMRDDED